MSDRVVVFVDYQNVYMSARNAFYPSPTAIPHWEGQVDPLALGQLMVTRSPFDRALAGVRIYRGVPDSTKDPKGLRRMYASDRFLVPTSRSSSCRSTFAIPVWLAS